MTMKTRTPVPGEPSLGVARPAPSQARGPDEKLTIAEVCAELKISRSNVLRLARQAARPALHHPSQRQPADPPP